MSKYGALIQNTRSGEGKRTTEEEKKVNVSIKAPLRGWQYWISKANKEGTIITNGYYSSSHRNVWHA